MIDVPKTAALSLLMTLALVPSWQIIEAADGVRGRHSLIHRPQIQPVPALTPTPSAPQPQLLSPPASRSTSAQRIQRTIVRRPTTPVSPIAEVAPMDPANSTQGDLPTTSASSTPLDDAPPEPEMIAPPESPHTEAR